MVKKCPSSSERAEERAREAKKQQQQQELKQQQQQELKQQQQELQQQQAAAQPQPQPQPQPQRDGKKSARKQRRELNRKNKDGNDMDAYVDTEAATKQEGGAESSAKATPAPSSSSPSPSSPPPPVAEEEAPAVAAAPAAAAPAVEAVAEPSAAPKVEVDATTAKSSDAGAEPEPKEVSPEPEPAPAEEEPQQQHAAEASTEVAVEALTPSPAAAPQVEQQQQEEEEKEEGEVTPEKETAVPEAAEGEDAPQKANGEMTEGEVYCKFLEGMGLEYKEDQWSPNNPSGKRQYDREFLLKMQANPESRKAPLLPHMPEITVDPKMVRSEEFNRQRNQGFLSQPDFTPGFFKSTNSPASRPDYKGQPVPKRGSLPRGRGGPPSQSDPRIILSMRQEVTLHKSENAYKPQFQSDVQLPEEEKETQTIMRKFKSILNKMTPEKFETLSQQALKLTINTEERLTGITELIFQKAISEPKFAPVYAELCSCLVKLPKLYKTIPDSELRPEERMKDTPKMKEVTFRGVLLNKCQREFEKDKEQEKELESLQQRMDNSDQAHANTEQQQKLMKEELELATKKARHRTLGNMKFIGELFQLKMLTENIMHDCIFKLLKLRDDDSIECLLKLMEVVGKELDHPKARQRMDQYFAQLEKMVADMKSQHGGSQHGGAASSSSASSAPSSSTKTKDSGLSPRIKFFILDILDLRKNGWVKRRIHDMNKPTKIEFIHQKVKQEEQVQQYLNSQPRPEPMSNRGGARPKGRGSAQGDADGWNTVPARVKQNIEPTRMKLTKTNVDVNNVNLGGGNKFRNWIQGSQGGGSRSQEQEKQGNRYSALNALADNDGRRGLGRSPARDGRGSSSRMDRDMDRRDRDRDFRRGPVPSRSSMEEKERALNTSRSMLGAGAAGGSSNPSSRNGSRDNSRSREAPPAKPTVLDASRMKPEELQRRLNTIVEEFIANASLKDSEESIVELRNLDYVMFVNTMMERLIEKSSQLRQVLGQLFFQLVRNGHLSVNDLVGGLREFLQFAEDLELDVPRIWDYLAEVLAGLVVDNRVLPLSFLRGCMKPLVDQGNGKQAVLMGKVLSKAAEVNGKEASQAQWAASGLQLAEFGVSDSDFKWLKGPARNMVQQEVYYRLKRKEPNEMIYRWIDENVSRDDQMSPKFVRELFSALCRHVMIPNSTDKNKVNKEELRYRSPLVRKFVATRETGTQALFSIQHLMCELEHPQGLASSLFETCYDEDMISEDSFYDWESREGPPEDNVGKGVVKLSTRDFFKWLRSGTEDERTS